MRLDFLFKNRTRRNGEKIRFFAQSIFPLFFFFFGFDCCHPAPRSAGFVLLVTMASPTHPFNTGACAQESDLRRRWSLCKVSPRMDRTTSGLHIRSRRFFFVCFVSVVAGAVAVLSVVERVAQMTPRKIYVCEFFRCVSTYLAVSTSCRSTPCSSKAPLARATSPSRRSGTSKGEPGCDAAFAVELVSAVAPRLAVGRFYFARSACMAVSTHSTRCWQSWSEWYIPHLPSPTPLLQ